MRVLVLFVALIVCSAVLAAERDSDAKSPQQKQLEKDFEQMLSGATLEGHYTVQDGAQDLKGESGAPNGLKAEKYTITRATPLRDDYWRFDARIQYGDQDVTVPLILRVKWAGDTPVITMDDVPVPGLGTFSARVMFFRGQYAGTWSAKDHGGHLFGLITRADEALEVAPEETEQGR
jgi:hypothetical protein